VAKQGISGGQTPVIPQPSHMQNNNGGSPQLDQGYSAVKRNDALGDYSNAYGQQTANRGTVAAIAQKQSTQLTCKQTW